MPKPKVPTGGAPKLDAASAKRGRDRPRGRPRDDALRDRRRAEILEGATRMFAERGYAGTDLQLLADALGVGKGTVYRYFPTKRDLLLAALGAGLERLDAEVLARVAGAADPLEAMELAFREVLAYFERNPDVVELLVLERAELRDRPRSLYYEHRDRTIGPWQQLLGELVAAGRLRPLPAERITDTMSDILYALVFTHRFAGRQTGRQTGSARASPAARAPVSDLVDVLLSGILSDAERARRARASPTASPTATPTAGAPPARPRARRVR